MVYTVCVVSILSPITVWEGGSGNELQGDPFISGSLCDL